MTRCIQHNDVRAGTSDMVCVRARSSDRAGGNGGKLVLVLTLVLG